MTTHAIAMITVTNPEAMGAYREKAGAALAKHGGTVLQASKELIPLEGKSALPSLIAVLSFPDQTSALAWSNDPKLIDVHALRNDAGTSNIILM